MILGSQNRVKRVLAEFRAKTECTSLSLRNGMTSEFRASCFLAGKKVGTLFLCVVYVFTYEL